MTVSPVVLDHPLAYNALAKMRNQETNTPEFRQAAKSLTQFVVYEATKNAATRTVSVETPICEAEVPILAEDPVIVGVWRAGQIMVDTALDMFENATAGYLGMFRNEETHQPEFYYENLPTLAGRSIYLVDPMLATGGSAVLSIEKLVAGGASDDSISLLCLIASQEGIDLVREKFPNVAIVAGAKDEKLNENAYIVPGLGDAGDRINNS